VQVTIKRKKQIVDNKRWRVLCDWSVPRLAQSTTSKCTQANSAFYSHGDTRGEVSVALNRAQ